MQAAVLKPVIQEMQLRTGESFFCQQPSLITVGAHHYRRFEFAGNQERLIAKLLRRSLRIYRNDVFGLTSVAAGKHVKLDTALLQHPSHHDDEWGLSTASSGNVPDAYDRTRQPAALDDPTVIE